MTESPEQSEARAFRALAAVIGRGWRIFPRDRASLTNLARELETSISAVKRDLIMSALIEVANEWRGEGRLIDVGNTYDWFDSAIRVARARLREERGRIAARVSIELELNGPPSPLAVLDIERESEQERELQALLDESPRWLRDVYTVLDRNPNLTFQDACHEAAVPLGRVRAFRHRHRRGPDAM